LSQGILGVRPGYDGLTLDPCIPKAWPGFKITREFRGAIYDIEVKNGGVNKGIKSLSVDGEPVPGNVLPLAKPGARVSVIAVLG
ncbi:MAG: glycosyl hydrolase family 65 protein, partial [bacterium]